MAKDGLRRRSGIWHLDVTIRRRRVRESCETPDRNEALSILRLRVAELEQHGSLALRAPKVTFDALAADLIRDYTVNKKRSTGKVKQIVECLRNVFGGMKAIHISAQDVRAYVEKQQRAGLANGTINRHLAALRRMYRLAADARLLPSEQIPKIEFLKEALPRSGFFEPEQFEAVLHHLRPEVLPIARFAFETGWRLREVITLERRQVNLAEGWVRLDAEASKNREGRLVYLSPGLLDLLRTQDEATRELERAKGVIIPWVFHRRGRRILRFLASWQTACRKAGLPGRLFHDLRRSAVRIMVRAGVPERVAMQISGHKTRSVFERYNITSEGDLQQAARRIAAYHGTNGITSSQAGPARPATPKRRTTVNGRTTTA